MADADLDVVIRKLAKQQHAALTAAINTRRGHYAALADKAKTPESKQRFKQLAKDAIAHGTAAAKRLQMSTDNAADSYARAMRKAADAPLPVVKPLPKPPARNASKKAPAKAKKS